MSLGEDERSLFCKIYAKHYKIMLFTAGQLLGRERGEEAQQRVINVHNDKQHMTTLNNSNIRN
jgi:hypothetical protein